LKIVFADNIFMACSTGIRLITTKCVVKKFILW